MEDACSWLVDNDIFDAMQVAGSEKSETEIEDGVECDLRLIKISGRDRPNW